MSAKKSVAFEITFDTDKVRRPKPKLSSRTPRKTFSKTNSTTIPKRGRHVSDKATVTTVLRETVLAGGQSLKIVWGNIIDENVDAIVNAANGRLAHNGGVAHSIAIAAGPSLQEECRKIILKQKEGRIPTGEVVHTGAGKLSCKYVIHAVGPIWVGGKANEAEKLQLVIQNVYKLAEELKAKSISLPAVSSGIFKFPKPKCAEIILNTTLEFYKDKKESSVQEIRLTNYDKKTCNLFVKEFEKHFGNQQNSVGEVQVENQKSEENVSDKK